MDRLDKIKNILLQYEIKICLFFFIILILVVIIEVAFRFLGLPLYWAEEIARYAFIWMIMFGCVVGVEKRIHYDVNIITRLLNKKIKRLIFILGNLVAVLFLSYVFYEGVLLCIRTHRATTPALGIPQYYAYLAIPITALLMLFHLLIQIYGKLFFERSLD